MTVCYDVIVNTIYVPMTCNLLVVGHIRLLKKVFDKGDVIVGLLSSKALKGYKKELAHFNDRKYILEALNIPMEVVKQDSLDPYENLKKYQCTHLASGDGFEEVEKKATKKLGVKLLKINSGSPTHSSDIKL